MVTNLILPFPPLVTIEVAGPVQWSSLCETIGDRLPQGVSFVVLRYDGPNERGGYFFHLRQVEDSFVFSTFDRDKVCEYGSGEECACLINHVCGFAYDHGMWEQSQKINLRTDSA